MHDRSFDVLRFRSIFPKFPDVPERDAQLSHHLHFVYYVAKELQCPVTIGCSHRNGWTDRPAITLLRGAYVYEAKDYSHAMVLAAISYHDWQGWTSKD